MNVHRHWMATLILALGLVACPTGPSISSFTATPSSLPAGGGGVKLEWTVSNADSLSIDQGVGAVSGTSTTVNVTASKTFTLTVTNAHGAASATSSVTVAGGPTSGSLQVNISGLPSGLTASVSVSGPGGFSQTLTASQNLTALAPGSYALTPAQVTQSGTYTDSFFTASASTATVSAGGAATAAVTYAQVPGSGKLWMPFNYSIGGYEETQLASGSSQPPVIAFAGGDILILEALVFDKDGNLWVSNRNYCNLFRFKAADLGKIGTLAPDITIGATRSCAADKLDEPHGLAFDKNGNLWVAEYSGSALTMYTPSQISASGDPTPLKITSTSLKNPLGLAFDKDGNLWVSDPGSHDLLMFGPDKLVAGGVQAPTRTLNGPALTAPSGGGAPAGMAFDKDGNLWVSNGAARTLLMFGATKLGAGGTQNPDKTVTPTVNPTGNGSGGLALDKAGNLWVSYGSSAADITQHRIVRINAADLTDGGTPKPAAELTGYQQLSLGALAFYPTPAGLPINH